MHCMQVQQFSTAANITELNNKMAENPDVHVGYRPNTVSITLYNGATIKGLI